MEDNKEAKKYRDNWTVILWWHGMLEKYMEGKLSGKQKELVDDWNIPHIRLTSLETETAKQITAEAKKEIDKVLLVRENRFSVPKETANPLSKRRIRLLPAQWNKYAAAAVLLLIVATTTLLLVEQNLDWHPGSQTAIAQTYFSTSDRERHRVTLPDGSVVLLNGGTTLRIRQTEYNRSQRELWLDEGEAFFEVTKNPQKPFIVHTPKLTTVVKGTSFNIKAYHDLATTEVMVRTGKVEIRSEEKTIGLFTPGQQLVYDNTTNQYTEGEASTENMAAWSEGKLVLKNAGVKELSLRIKQTYGLQLVVAGHSMDGKHISASFAKGTSLENVMETISLLHGVHYAIDQKEVTIY
jgi:transmembrane sensor